MHIHSILSGQSYPLFASDFTPKQIIDIGANIGATALFFASHYPNAQVYCYEPSASNFHFLEINTSDIENIVRINSGLSDRNERKKLYMGRSQCLQHSVYRSIEVTEEFEYIDLKSASEEISKYFIVPCIIKIDTEGCEVPILRDIKDFLHHISVIYLEYHSENDRLVIDQLLKADFKLLRADIHIVHRGNLMYVSNTLLAKYPQLNILEVNRK
jgi:FkbM family methyltransferase